MPGELYLLPLEQRLALLRGVYTKGISEIMESCLEQMMLPGDQEGLLDDALQFMAFLFSVKLMEIYQDEQILGAFMRRFRGLVKKIEREVPGMFVEYAKAYRQAQENPAANEEKTP